MEIELLLGLLVPLAFAGGYLLGSRRARVASESEPEPVEVQGVSMAPQGGHKHIWNMMFSDGRGWVCGETVAPGVICGWSREFGKGGPQDG